MTRFSISQWSAILTFLTFLPSPGAWAQDRPVTSVSPGRGVQAPSAHLLEFVLEGVADAERRPASGIAVQRLQPGDRGTVPDGERRTLRAVLDHGRPGTIHPRTRFKVLSGHHSLAIVWANPKLGDVQVEGRSPGKAVLSWEILDVPDLAGTQRSGRLEIVVEKSQYTAAAPAAPGSQQYLGDHLYRLRTALANARGELALRAELAALAREFRCAVREGYAQDGRRTFWVDLAEPVRAALFAHEMGWGRPYGVAADAQRSIWVLNTSSGSDDSSRYLRQLALATPQLGDWSVTARLSGVPQGGVPQASNGGSPIYDLTQSEGQVVSLAIAPVSPGQAVGQPPLTPEPTDPGAQGPPTSALSTTTIRRAIEANRGAGIPSYLETQFENTGLFIAWNMPYAGRTTTQYWVYCRATVSWNLVQGYQIEPGRYPVRQARIDTARRAVEFVLETGAVVERVPVGGCQ
jgi:hypothetical protein